MIHTAQAFIAAVLLSIAASLTSTFTVGVLVFFGIMILWYSIYRMFIGTRDNMIIMHKSIMKEIKKA